MVEQTGWSNRAVFPAAEVSVGRARAFVTAQLAAHQMHHLREDVQLVVSELAANAVAHAATPFFVTIEELGPSIRVTVDDGSLRHPSFPVPEDLATNGRGLMLVRHLSSDWGVSGASDRGAKGVWAAFDTAVGPAYRLGG